MSDGNSWPRKPLDRMGSCADEWPVGVGNITSYREPWVNLRADDLTQVDGVWADLARTSKAVAPSDPGQESKNQNRIREGHREFIFLDVGRWLKDSRAQARDFGLIWGRHVYLCEYRRRGFPSPMAFSREGLDTDFFRGMGNSCQPIRYASATWAEEADFEWDHLCVILPDMHLMAHEQATVWYGDDARHMQPERDFWDFALRLTSVDSLRGKVTFIQIGDSYDLWVDCRPMNFIPDPVGRKVNLRTAVELLDVPQWVHRIQGMDRDGKPGVGTNWVFDQLSPAAAPMPSGSALSGLPEDLQLLLANRANEFATEAWQKHVVAGPRIWRNPADAAFRLLEERLGADVLYIYGNHDNYLAHSELCAAIGLRERLQFKEFRGVYIEHGHRMEIPEIVSHPIGGYNSDGLCEDAWTSTNTVYDHMSGGQWSFSGWGESNVRLPDRFLPLFADNWMLKVPAFVSAGLIEFVPGGIKWALGKAGLTGDLPYHLPADISFAAWFDQPWYIQEYARVWVGRHTTEARLPPHIFVIGHTHLPMLAHLKIFRDTPRRRMAGQ